MNAVYVKCCMLTSWLCMERDGRSTITLAFMTIGRQSDRRSVIKVKKSDHCYQTHYVCHFISCSRYSGDKLFFFAVALPDPMLDSSVWEKYSSVSRQLWWKEEKLLIKIFYYVVVVVSFFPKESRAQFSHRLFWAVIFWLSKRTLSSILCQSSVMCFRKRNFV